MKVSPDNVLRIVLDSEFATHETFTRAFVRRFDISPSEFRAVLKQYRAYVGDGQGNRTLAGSPTRPRSRSASTCRRIRSQWNAHPDGNLLFVRHHGYENLLAPSESFLSLWDELFAYAEEHDGIDYSPDVLLGITHDGPYVTEEPRIRFDACLQVDEPVSTKFPIGYRYLPSRLCVRRSHTGGLEEIANTFAHIGVNWLPSSGYGLAAAPPFELYHRAHTADGEPQILYADAYVPLDTTQGEA